VTKEYVPAETRVEERWRYVSVSEDEAVGVLVLVYLPVARAPE
jgi:hypothetical protein